MSRPRILFVYQFLSLGGVETVLRARLRELLRRGIDARVLFLASHGGESLFTELADQVVVRTAEPAVAEYLAEFLPEWVISIDTPAALPLIRRVLPAAHLAYEVHTPYPESYAVLLDPALYPGLAGILVPAPSQGEFIRSRIARPLPIRVAPNPLPPFFFDPAPQAPLPDRPVVAWVGRLDRLKNYRGFVQLAGLLRQRIAAEFWMIGGLRSPAEEQARLWQAVKEVGLVGALRWLPAVDHCDMPGLYRAVAASGGCVVSTSWAESFGMGALEAMACNCPVVVPDVVGLRDLVRPGETGWLYPPGFMERAADCVLEAIHEGQQRRQIIERAATLARGFTAQAAVDTLLAALEEWSGTRFLAPEPLPATRTPAAAARGAAARGEPGPGVAAAFPGRQLLEDVILQQAQELQSLSGQLARQTQESQSLSEQLARQTQQLDSITEHFEALDGQLKAIYRSRVWRWVRWSWEWGRAVRGLLRHLSYGNFRELLRTLIPYDWRHRAVSAGRRLRGRVRPPHRGLQRAPSELAHGRFDISNRYDLICLPIIDWEFRFQRPQQLMSQFARNGHRSFYLRTTFHQQGSGVLRQDVAENVFGVQFPGPADLDLYRDEISPLVLEGFLAALDRLRLEAGIVAAVLLVQLPFWAPLALAARQRWGWKVVYDCMDEHAGFSNTAPAMLQQEQRLLRESDLVLATARLLHEKVAPLAQRTLLLPNAGEFEHFQRGGPAPAPLAGLPGPVIGYYGAIAEWFDVEMVSAAARARPGWQFVLIGHTFGADLSSIQGLPNVHLLGEKTYAELPAYLHRFDVACIPFKLTPLTRATNPVKFFEYLSAGKPVVSVELPELEPYRELFYPVRTPAEFVSQVEAALRERDPAVAEARRTLARQNTWQDRYRALSEAIRGLYGRAAVIVVSYNNRGYLRLCLERLWARAV